ncbi:MAG: hypothetical protein ACLP9C_06440 [Acidimicrobiales bacterium]
MGLFGSKPDVDAGRLRQSGADTVQLVIDYVKQETVEPLRGVGRFLIFGIAGSVALCVGLVLLLVGFLRFLQTETDGAFAGNLSWLPYVIVSIVGLVIIGLFVWRITAGPATRRLPPQAKEGKR